jgi:hypothetical protein
MRTLILAVLAALATGVFLGTRIARAGPDQGTFTLEQHDRLIAEAPGCYASCQVFGLARRCTLREPDCHAICLPLPECKPDGLRPMQVCTVVRDRP